MMSLYQFVLGIQGNSTVKLSTSNKMALRCEMPVTKQTISVVSVFNASTYSILGSVGFSAFQPMQVSCLFLLFPAAHQWGEQSADVHCRTPCSSWSALFLCNLQTSVHGTGGIPVCYVQHIQLLNHPFLLMPCVYWFQLSTCKLLVCLFQLALSVCTWSSVFCSLFVCALYADILWNLRKP